jgi:hypothetical protein
MRRILSISTALVLVLSLGITSIFGASSAVNAATGGPDTYGYYYIDSAEPTGPTYSWVEISGSGTATGLGDDWYTVAIPLGFTFNYYGTDYTSVYIMDNGWISFVDQDTWYQLANFPNSDTYVAPISPLSTDLDPSAAGEVYYQTLGTDPNRTFVVEWDGVPHYSAGGSNTFEIILYEGSNDIEFQYNSLTQSGNVGIEDQTQAIGLDYSYAPSNSLAILFYFVANTPPNIPTLNSPGDGATGVSLTPNLVFNYSDPDNNDCTKFDLQVDDDPLFGSPEINETDYSTGGPWSSGNPITYSVSSPLAPGTQYYWMARVFDGTDWSGWSDGTWDFTTIPPNTPPNIPTLNSPSDGATGVNLTPNLVFNYSDPDNNDCTKFDLQVDDDSLFGSPEINETDYSAGGPWSSGNPITYSVSSPLAPGTQYYWMVRVFDGMDWSGWSDGSWDFTTGAQSGGSDSDTYYPDEDVTVSATGFPPNSFVDVYVVDDYTWTDLDSIPADVGDSMDTIQADGSGNITNEVIWSHPLDIGEYDIVFDAGQDGVYNEVPDLVDDPNHPGFTVIAPPPAPRGAVGGTVYPINKAAILMPWLGLAFVLILAVGGSTLALRRRRTHK